MNHLSGVEYQLQAFRWGKAEFKKALHIRDLVGGHNSAGFIGSAMLCSAN